MATVSEVVGIIGCGSMGGSIARGLIASGTCDASRVIVCDHHAERLEALSADSGAQVVPDVDALLAEGPDAIILAVKPQVISSVVKSVADSCAGTLVVSIAAGKPLGWFVGQGLTRVVRVMPNLPVSVRSGASAIAAVDMATGKDTAAKADVELVRTLFSSLGSAFVMREDQLDAEGAVIGCAPAYFALFVDALTRAGIRAGIPAEATREMVESTMLGTARSLLESGEHPRSYLEGVTSPGGTTAAALRELEPLMCEGAYDAVDAALERTHELA
ncbi:MAG: pyrroline-5-carboxylate reductase [Atopobiaceae bacterium]|jgi:pyrroline-5-carboxylate reductase|nr:pyrroline-5-carboxylate reductase [Atopobiaceae bacterium]MCI2173375.1 pyrroline-5-carboxylate reductase [Atopobiaceae bacterium]MCI2207370.1 pyrroline-5-carboxylate reductase [Atopobiaceae bacterium]